MNQPTIRMIVCVSLGGLALAAPAQQPPPPAAPAAAAPAPAAQLPRHSCAKPGEYPGNLASDNQRRGWQSEYAGYVRCLEKFVKEQQALAEPHVKASNAAIDEHNTAVKDYNAQLEKAKAN